MLSSPPTSPGTTHPLSPSPASLPLSSGTSTRSPNSVTSVPPSPPTTTTSPPTSPKPCSRLFCTAPPHVALEDSSLTPTLASPSTRASVVVSSLPGAGSSKHEPVGPLWVGSRWDLRESGAEEIASFTRQSRVAGVAQKDRTIKNCSYPNPGLLITNEELFSSHKAFVWFKMVVKVKVDRPIMAETETELPEELQQKVKKYLRGDAANLEGVKDKKLRGQLTVREKLYGHSAKAAAKVEKWLMPSEEGYLEAEGLEKTYKFKQESIINEVDMQSSRKPFDMVLPELGPYNLNFTASGRHMLLAGRKGHLSIIDMFSMNLVKEFQVRETVRDATFLHNEQFFAVAQKKYPYIYNRHGIELHCLKEHIGPRKLQFLDKHFLLVSINKFGQMHYQDVTTGLMVANYRTGLGRTDVMEVNPFNAVIALGHSGGKVTMWKPTSSKPLVTMLCHPGPVTAVAFHNGGHIMATAGLDNKIKIWDVRKFEALHSYPRGAVTLDFSQKGLLAVGNGAQVEIRRDMNGNHDFRSYMKHSMVKGYQIGRTVFRPYEDVLGIGHSMGMSCILVPGSGEPNFDTWVANPYETSKQRREREIHALLDKLPPESIMLNPKLIGNMRPWKEKERPSKREIEAQKEAAIKDAKNVTMKKKTKGRNKPSKRAKRKYEEVEKAKKPYLEDANIVNRPLKRHMTDYTDLPKALQRFAKNKPA